MSGPAAKSDSDAAPDSPKAPPAPTGVHRAKRPAQVREALLQAATAQAAQQGVAALTLRAVARAAGVTKGGLLHHFPDKAALLAALRTHAISLFETALNSHLVQESGPGRFTRAYVRACLSAPGTEPDLWSVPELWADAQLRADWYAWFAAQEALHAETDGDMHYKLVRLAADGAWLAALDGADPGDWREGLLALGSGSSLPAR